MIPEDILNSTIDQLGSSIVDNSIFARLDEGVRIIARRPLENTSLPETLKIIIPAFTHTVYESHGFQIPVSEYLSTMYEYFDAHFSELKTGAPIQDGIDEEMNALLALTESFMASFQ